MNEQKPLCHPSGYCQGSTWSHFTGEDQDQERLMPKSTCCVPGELGPGCTTLTSRTLTTHHPHDSLSGSTCLPLTLVPCL